VDFQHIAEVIGGVVDALGVAVIVLGVLWATGAAALRLRRGERAYQPYRRQLGRSILLGLEFLVAADIIRTVAVEPSFASVGVLAVIVAIRTFLSFSLELEITGRWPWQKPDPSRPEDDGAPAATDTGPRSGAAAGGDR
jgi:uncharacterized membrane protein